MKEGNKRADKKILTIALSILSATVIILLTINVVLLFTKNNSEDLAAECLELSDKGEAEQCLNEKSFKYYQEEDCYKATKVYDDIPADYFDQYTMTLLYEEAYSTSVDCEDPSLEEYWRVKSEALSSQMEALF